LRPAPPTQGQREVPYADRGSPGAGSVQLSAAKAAALQEVSRRSAPRARPSSGSFGEYARLQRLDDAMTKYNTKYFRGARNAVASGWRLEVRRHLR